MQTWFERCLLRSFHWVELEQPLVGLDSHALVAFAIFEMLPGLVCVAALAAARPFVLESAGLDILAFLATRKAEMAVAVLEPDSVGAFADAVDGVAVRHSGVSAEHYLVSGSAHDLETRSSHRSPLQPSQ